MTERASKQPAWLEQARRLAEDGCPISEIAETVKASPSTVSRWAHPGEKAAQEWLHVRGEIGSVTALQILHKEIMLRGSQVAGKGTRVQRSSRA